MPDEEEDDMDERGDTASEYSRTSVNSMARSIHPSVAGSALSQACSDTTIGAGDATDYWDFAHRLAGMFL